MDESEFDIFCRETGLDPDVAPIAFADWNDSYRPFADWWADHQGEYA